jgi:hypothetical protein
MEKEEEFEYKNILESYDSTVDVMRVVEKYFVRIGETYDTIANEKDEETAIRIINEQISNLIETNYPGDDIGNERNHLGEFIERVIRFHDNHKLNEYNAKNRQDSIFRDIIEGYFDDLREKVDYELSLDARKSSAKIYNSEREAAQKIENAFGDIVNIVRADRRIVSEVELIKEYSQAGYSSREISRSDKRKAVKVVSQPTEYEEVEKTDAEIAAEQAVQFIRLLDGVATSDSKKTYEDYTNEFLNNYKKHIHNSRVKKLLVEMVAERVMTKPELIGSTLKSKEKNTLLKDNLGGIIEDILEFISADPGEIAASKDTTLEEGFTGTAKSTMRRKLRYLRNENPELDLKIASKDVYRAKADRRDVRTHIVPITTADGKLFRILPIVTKHSHNKAV